MLKFKANNTKNQAFLCENSRVDELKLKGIPEYHVVLQDMDRACILGIAKGKKAVSVQNVIDRVKKNE